jgi:hypothetical protein
MMALGGQMIKDPSLKFLISYKENSHINPKQKFYWFLNSKNGKIICNADGEIVEEYDIKNPPPPGHREHSSFVAICELAVQLKLLRPGKTYTLMDENETQ